MMRWGWNNEKEKVKKQLVLLWLDQWQFISGIKCFLNTQKDNQIILLLDPPIDTISSSSLRWLIVVHLARPKEEKCERKIIN